MPTIASNAVRGYTTGTMDWATRRKLTYMTGIFLVLGTVAFFVVRSVTNVPPTCMDNKRNGDETGVDCGGICVRYCANELGVPKVRFVRTFEITPGIVHAVAYIEHSYPGAASRKVDYSFKLYDDRNTLITERTGTTFIGPMGRTAIVETIIPTKNITPAITRFSISEPVQWEKIPDIFSTVVIKTDRTRIESFDRGTRLTATLENNSRLNFTDLDVVAILYDADDNAITSSKALLKKLPGESAATVYFTWPFELTSTPSRIEVIPRYNPFTATSL